MADVARLHDEDDVFGDVRGVVADALEMTRHENQVDAGLDRARIAQHVGQHLPKDLFLERVQPVVLPQHGLRQVHVSRDECIERLAEHLQGELPHARKVDQGLDRRMHEVALRDLGDASVSQRRNSSVNPT